MKLSRNPDRLMATLATLIAVVAFGGTARAADHGYRTIYRFQGGNDGWTPIGLPAVDKNGDLYGVTGNGVSYNGGTIYKLTAPQTHGGRWTKTLLHTFPNGNGGYAVSVVIGADGPLYGFAFGPEDPGFVWKLTPPASGTGVWKYAVLYAFTGNSDGGYPQGNPVFDAEGNLYGATGDGGDVSCHCGTVFELQRPKTKSGKWRYEVLHTFTGDPDGNTPYAGVTFDQKGNLYGTTNYGGTYGYGTTYRLKPPRKKGGAWTESVLYSFDGSDNIGSSPEGPLLVDSSGDVYGTTAFGGDLNCQGGAGCGVVFELVPPTEKDKAWTYTTLYAFQGGNDGVYPEGYIVFDSQGNLYSTTVYGGDAVGGTVFRLTGAPTESASWTESVLHWFPDNNKDGYEPVEGLTWGKWGDLYGVAWVGGTGCVTLGCGTVFELQP